MATGLCPACGTPAAIDASFCDRCGSHLGRSFVSLEPTVSTRADGVEAQRVVVNTPRRRFAPALAVIAALALLFAGVAFAFRGEEPESVPPLQPSTSTTLPSASTVPIQRTSANYLMGKPAAVFGSSSIGFLYIADGSLVKRVDLETGEIVERSLPSSGAVQLIVVESGIFVVNRGGEVFALREEIDQAPALVGSGGYAVPGGADRIWVSRDHFCTDCATSVWFEVDLDGRAGPAVELARGTTPVAGVDKGLLWQTPRGISLGRKDLSRSYINGGDLVSARGDTAVWFGCDDVAGLECFYRVGDSANANRRKLDIVATAGRPSASLIERIGAMPISLDHSTIALPRITDNRIPIVDLPSGEVRMVGVGMSVFRYNTLAFTTNGDWLVLFQSSARTSLKAVNTRTNESYDVKLPIESNGDVAIGVR